MTTYGDYKIHSGELKLLGSSHSNNSERTYSLIEIGEDVIQNVWVVHGLDNYLNQALDYSSAKIYTHEREIVAVAFGDKKYARSKLKKIAESGMASEIIPAIIGSALFAFIPLLFLPFYISKKKKERAAAQGILATLLNAKFV